MSYGGSSYGSEVYGGTAMVGGGGGGTRTPADSEGLTDLTPLVAAYVRSQADTLGLSDAVSYLIDNMAVHDTEHLTDAISTLRSVQRSLANGEPLSDAHLILLGKLIDEPAGLSDILAVGVAALKAVADDVGSSDSLLVITSTPGGAGVAESETLSDLVTLNAVAQSPFTETVVLGDTVGQYIPPSPFDIPGPPSAPPLFPYPTGPVVTLGCPVYDVYVYLRGGLVMIGELTKITQVTYNRVLNNVSSATVTMKGFGSGISQRCCDLLASLNPWQHEIGIFRNNKLVWCGPITHLVYDTMNMQVTISASDILSWMDHRVLHDNIFATPDVPMTDIFYKVFMSAANPDLSFRPTLAITRGTLSGTANYLVTQVRIAGDIIRELGASTIDYTVIKRTLFAHSVELNLPAVTGLHDNHWTIPPQIEVNGEDMGTSWFVTGPGGGNGYDLYGRAYYGTNGVDPDFGLLEKVAAEPNIVTDRTDVQITNHPTGGKDGGQVAIDRNAANRLALFGKPLVYTVSGKLSRDFPMDMNELIPGMKLDVRLNNFCRPILTQYRLQQINVTVNTKSENVETVLVPLGAVRQFDPSAFQPQDAITADSNPVTLTPTSAPSGGSPNYQSAISDGIADG